jgi:HPr kinase/phosphorylase
VIESLRYFLSKNTADSTSMHGVLMDVLGMGVLISGESGLGKSELALELISRGHGLWPATSSTAADRSGDEGSRGLNMLEVRGQAADIGSILGGTAVPRKKMPG